MVSFVRASLMPRPPHHIPSFHFSSFPLHALLLFSSTAPGFRSAFTHARIAFWPFSSKLRQRQLTRVCFHYPNDLISVFTTADVRESEGNTQIAQVDQAGEHSLQNRNPNRRRAKADPTLKRLTQEVFDRKAGTGGKSLALTSNKTFCM